MKKNMRQFGLTLIEMMVVIALIAILASIVITVAARIHNRAKENLARNTIAILNAALDQFRDFGYRYDNTVVNYSGFAFPLDCNDFLNPDIQKTLQNALGADSALIDPVNSTHLPEYSGCEAMYFFLSRIPDCRKTLDRIDKSLLTNLDANKQPMELVIDYGGGQQRRFPLLRVIDPWGTTLHYDYYDELRFLSPPFYKRNFPVIRSAGPDQRFWTADDITNRN